MTSVFQSKSQIPARTLCGPLFLCTQACTAAAVSRHWCRARPELRSELRWPNERQYHSLIGVLPGPCTLIQIVFLISLVKVLLSWISSTYHICSGIITVDPVANTSLVVLWAAIPMDSRHQYLYEPNLLIFEKLTDNIERLASIDQSYNDMFVLL